MQVKPICTSCEMAMRPHVNGVLVVETYDSPPMPYKLWGADEWKCPVCGMRVIVGFSEKSIHAPYAADERVVIDRMEDAIEDGRFRAWKERATDKVVPEEMLRRYIERVNGR